MSKIGKISFALSILFFVISTIAVILVGTMHPAIYVPLGLALLMLLTMFVVEWKLLFEFLTMKTTRHGMNMGWLILMALATFALANFLSVRFDKKWDLTSEGVNTLSEQSLKVIDALKSDLKIVLLVSKQEQAEMAKQRVQETLRQYTERSKKIKFISFSALNRPDLAQKYEFKNGEVGLFAEYEDKHLKIDALTEEGITKTILKLTRPASERKAIYFTQGHGERNLDSEAQDGASGFKSELEVTYAIKNLQLTEGDVRKDAAAVVILGPSQSFLPAEIEKIKNYAKEGGHLLILGDPSQNTKSGKSNMSEIAKIFGVDFKNDYILDTRVQLSQVGPILALGSIHSKNSDISKSVNEQLFLIASSLGKLPSGKDFHYEELSSTNMISSSVPKLEERPQVTSKGPHVIMMQVNGKLEGSEKEFAVVIAGDSDFASNQLFYQYGNRDMLLNSVSYLAKDMDLISIHPKTAKATKIEFVGNYKLFLGIILLLSPFGMLITSGVIWWRRRTA